MFRSSRSSARSGIGYVNDRPHPGMNAALKLVRADGQIGAGSGSWFNTTRRNENNCSEVQTLRRRYRVAGNAVELVDKSATELSYRSKSVNLATAILD